MSLSTLLSTRSQSLSLPSQISANPGPMRESPSSQSPAQTRALSLSASASLVGVLPLQSLSCPSQISDAPM